jgi:hypothetical protein
MAQFRRWIPVKFLNLPYALSILKIVWALLASELEKK